MKIRSTLHIDGDSLPLQLSPILNETDDHLRLKLAAFVFFHQHHPIVLNSAQQHPALADQDFSPDLLAADDANQVSLWIECGKTTLHKLEKAKNRFRQARIVMLFAQPHEAKQMAEALAGDGNDRVEVWSFPLGDFKRWSALIQEQNDLIGEAAETSMNLVVNSDMFMTELIRVR